MTTEPHPMNKKTNYKRGRPCKPIDWSKVDWRYVDRVIAESLDCTDATVNRWRHLFNRPKGTLGRKESEPRPLFDHGKINWALCDAENGRRLGVSRERIRQLRKEAGLKPSRGRGKPGQNGFYAF